MWILFLKWQLISFTLVTENDTKNENKNKSQFILSNLRGVVHWNWIWVPFFLFVEFVKSFEIEMEVSRPDKFVSLGIGQRGKLHSIWVRAKSEQTVGEVSFTVGSVGLM
jgi:hypothetical protein